MKVIKNILSVEFLFALFLFAGYFKTVFTFIPLDLTILLFVITFIMSIVKIFKGKKIKLTPILLWMGFLIFATISLLITPYMPIAIDKYIRLVIISTWCFIGPLIIFDDRMGLKLFIYGILTLGIVMGITSFFTNQNDAGFVDVFGSNYQALSRISGSTSLVLLGVFLFSKNSFKIRIITLITSVILILPMLMSGGRLTAIIYLIILLVIFPLMFFEVNMRKSKIKIYKRIYAYIITLGVIAVGFIVGNRMGFLDTFVFRIKVIFEEQGGGASISGRTDRMETALDMIQKSPFLGEGLGSFGIYYTSGLINDTPHNIFLEIASEMGLLALILFIVIFVLGTISVYKVWKNNKNDWIYTSIFILSFFWIVSALISSGLTSGKILFAFLGISIASFIIYKNVQSKEKELYL